MTAVSTSARQKSAPAAPSQRRHYLKASDDIEAAPSIGARSAQKLAEAAIFTVGDLLAADADVAAQSLTHLGINADTLRLWQRQARLVIDVPGLRGMHAQLLTGAGYLDADAVASADVAELCSAVLRFAGTREGQRILWQDGPPPVEKIEGWIASAAAARAAA